jgi:hypothetical protein
MKVEILGDHYDAGEDAFLDAAAVMENLDLIIGSDTSIAHLAGAMGRPVWAALKHVPDWRWLLDRSDSPGIRRCGCSGSARGTIGTAPSRKSKAHCVN